ncbi:MAG TPA: ribosome maturation factor RimM [Acidobacteriota bacterium]|nr:ribosome maturation factor RimM [Acidobacteriota bacterium]
MSGFVTIAHIVKARGVRGEVAAEILTDFPDRFQKTADVRVKSPSGEFQERLQWHRFHQGRVLLKFEGRESPQEVEELIWGDVQVPLQERVAAPQGHYYNDELIGCRVENSGEPLGQVEDVLEIGGGQSNLVVRHERGGEWQLPLVSEFVVAIDVQRRLIEARPPRGLLELAVEPGPGKRKRRRARRAAARSGQKEPGSGDAN